MPGRTGASAPAATVEDTDRTDEQIGDYSAALAHYATAVSLSLEASRLEQLFNYQYLRSGVRQPSLLRDAADLRNRALDELDSALSHDAENALLLRRKGEILLDLDRIDEATALFSRAARIEPAIERWYFSVANKLEMMDKTEAAASVLEDGVREPSPLSSAYRQLALLEIGRLHHSAGRLEAAEEAYRRALDALDGAIAIATGPVARAFAEGMERDPTGVRRILVAVLIGQEKHQQAIDEARKALTRSPADPRALGALVEALLAADREAEAVDEARDFFAKHPSNQLAALTFMRLLARTSDIDGAMETGRRYLAEAGADAKVRAEIVSILRQAGRIEEAERFVFADPEGVPGYAEALALLDIYVDAGDEVKARDLAGRILEETPLDVQAAFQVVGRLFRGLGEEAAEGFADEFSETHETDHRALYAFARVLAAGGDVARAGEVCVRLAQRGAPYGDVYEVGALYLLEIGDAYGAARIILDGIEGGFVSDGEVIRRQLAETDGPAEIARRLAAAAGEYDAAQNALYEFVADLYSAAERYSEAEEFYRRSLEGPAPQLFNYVGLAISLYQQDKATEAIELVEELIDSGRGAPPLVRMLVAMLSRDERYDEARRLVNMLIADTPTDVDNRLALAGIYIHEEYFDNAEEQLNIARRLAEGDEEMLRRVRYYLGIVYDEQGRDSLAVSMWQANLSSAPDDPDSNNALAYHYATRGTKLEEAIELVNKALEQEPNNAAYIDTLGWIYYKMGRYDEALEQLSLAADKLEDAEILDHLADALMAVSDRQGAYETWRRALDARPRPSRRGKIEEKLEKHFPEHSGAAGVVQEGDANGGP